MNLIHLTGMEKSMKNQYQDAQTFPQKLTYTVLFAEYERMVSIRLFEQLELKPGMASGAGMWRF